MSNIACAQELLILRLILNGEERGDYYLLRNTDNDIWMQRDDFHGTGLKKGLGRDIIFEQDRYVSLRSINGLDFHVNEDGAFLEVTAVPHLFKEQDIDSSYKKQPEVRLARNSALFLNYAGIYIHESDSNLINASGEMGISIDEYLGRSTFIYEKIEERENVARLMSNLTINNRDQLQTIIFGDVIASSGALGSESILGGVTIFKNFFIDPHFLKSPALSLKGTLETRSEVELYLDGQLIRRDQLSPGEFVLNDVPATAGLGSAKIIIKDLYGREKIISTPYYYSESLLRKGLHEYSYSMGYTRANLGEKNFDYGKPAFLALHNVGLSNNLKVGYAAEASDNLVNVGPSVSVMVSNAGVVNAAFAMSSSKGESGSSGLVGYSFQSRNFSTNIFLRSNSENYSNLIISPSDDKAKVQFSGSVGFGGRKMGFITALYSLSRMHIAEQVSTTAVSYNRSITRDSTFFINAGQTRGSETDYEILIGLHMYFGKKVSGNLSHTGGDDAGVTRAGIQKSLPVGSGIGYRADIENTQARYNFNGNLQYQNNYGIYELGYWDRKGNEGFRASLAGGVGYIDKSTFFSRPITDSFAKVTVGELEGVRVYSFGNEAGRTNRKGEVIIPNLHSFHDNRIEIEPSDIPINYDISKLSRRLSPSFRSGSVVEFDIKKIQGIVGNLYMLEEEGEVPVGSAIMLIHSKDGVIEGLVGSGGEFYVENVPFGKHPAQVMNKEQGCKFSIIIPDSDEMLIDLGKITCEANTTNE